MALSVCLNELLAQPGFGNAQKLNNGWMFSLNSTDTIAASPAANAQWQKVDLPHDWSVKQKLDPKNASSMGYLPGGIGWYKKTVVVPASGKQVYLYFEGVYNRSEVFINGKSVGKRPNGYISFMYDITPYIRFNQPNEILVKADHHRDADSRWYTGSGIYRDVWLVYANPVHIAQWGVYAYPEVANNTGTLHIETDIVNTESKSQKVTIVSELLNAANKVIGQTSNTITVAAHSSGKQSAQIKIADPQLWSLNNPVLYKLHTKVLKEGKQLDANTTVTGFRQLTFDPNRGFALNGEWMKVKGVCLHHDAGVLGAAMYKEVWRRRLLNLKEVGVSAVRTSHNPQATVFYELCDELGLLVLNEAFDEWEFPKRKWLEGWNAGTPGFQGTYDFFEEWGEKDLADMVRRDRNHISVFAWSIGNEVDYPNDPYSHPILDGDGGFTQKAFGGYKKNAPDAMRLGVIAKKLAAAVRQYDRSRPVTAGLAGVAMSNETEYPGALDIAGYNYTESRYISDHKKYPKRVIYGSENRHDFGAWKAVTNNEHIFGQFLWTGIDYLGESGRWPSRGFYSGLLDFGGFIKPRGYFRQSLWAEKSMVYIGTYPVGSSNSKDVLSQTEGRKEEALPMDAWAGWNYKEGQTIRVVCYTNAPKARLTLNGKQTGEIKNYDHKTGIVYWDVPYQPGELKAEGIDDAGKTIAVYSVKTSGAPYAIKLITNMGRDQDQVAQVAVQVIDKNGVPVTNTDAEITCTITGSGTLLGLEAGDNSDMGDYTDHKQKTFRGRLIAYVKKPGKAGAVKVTFSASGLKGVTVTL
ncbi:glycoside hydrolase family 2 TIM barrel-domain containing protein [Niabella aquatica]